MANAAWKVASVGFFVLISCTPGALEGGRYACDRDAGAGEQCPEDWRCGNEGFCRKVGDVSKAWRCALDADCEGRWVCGLSSSRDFRECHDPKLAAAAFACAADTDCVQQWRCGLEGVCHSPSKAAAYVCVSDAGYSDTWCEQGWRCTVEGTCTNPQADALRELSLPPFPAGTLINPEPGVGPISRFSVSQVYASGIGARLQSVVWAGDAGLSAFVIDRTGAAPPLRYTIPGASPLTFAAHGTRGEFQVGTQSPLAEPETQVFVINRDAGVVSIALLEDGGTESRPMDFFPSTRLTLGTAGTGLTPRAFAFNPDPDVPFAAASGPTSVWFGPFKDFFDVFSEVPDNRILDLTGMRAGLAREAVFAIDERGLWVMDRDFNNCFVPTLLPPLTRPYCMGPQPITHRPTGLRPFGLDDLGVSSQQLDGGGDFLTHLDVSAYWTEKRDCTTVGFEACTPQGRVPLSIFLGPCRACPSGKLLDFSLVQGKPAPRFELACSGVDGGPAQHFAITAGTGQVPTCTREAISGESSLFGAAQTRVPEQATPGVVTYGDGARNVWVGPGASRAVSLTLSRAPAAVARSSAGQPFMLTELATGVREAGVGVFEHPGVRAVSGVAGQPSWVLLKDGQVVNLAKAQRVFDSDLVAKVGSVASFDPPYSAVQAKTATGTKALVVTAGFSLLAGEGDELPLRFTAAGPISSIAFPATPVTSGYLEGYAISGGEVLKLTASAVHRWSDAAVATPLALVPMEVWYDDERARVGFDDGTVFSLPSRVEIAGSLKAGEEVVDYVQVCGQQLALGSKGLYRLEPVAGQAVGRWVSLPLPAGFGAGGFERGRAHASGNALYVFTRGGDAASWTIPGCP